MRAKTPVTPLRFLFEKYFYEKNCSTMTPPGLPIFSIFFQFWTTGPPFIFFSSIINSFFYDKFFYYCVPLYTLYTLYFFIHCIFTVFVHFFSIIEGTGVVVPFHLYMQACFLFSVFVRVN